MNRLKRILNGLISQEAVALVVIALVSYSIIHYFHNSHLPIGEDKPIADGAYFLIFISSSVVGLVYLKQKNKRRKDAIIEKDLRIQEVTKIISSTPSCLKILDKNGLLIEMNRQGLELIEAPDMDSVRGANVYDLVEESHKAKFKAFNERICQGESGRLVFEIVALKGTRRWMETYAAPYSLADGSTGHVAITNEITDVIKAQNELEEQKKLALHNAKLASIGELASGVGHEINNPLAIINGYINVLESHAKENQSISYDELKKYLLKINAASDRIERIVRGLRTFSRSDVHELNDFDPVLCIEESIDMVFKIYQIDGIQLQFNSKNLAGKTFILGNRGKLQQVIMNLLSNAKDALANSEKKEISVELQLVDQLLKIEVKDSGSGIDENIQNKIFDPFFTTKEINKGTGIGLSLVHNFIKEFNGNIKVESQLNKGSLFTILLPISMLETQSPKSDSSKKVPPPSAFHCNVLVVDDEPEIRDVLVYILEQFSMTVMTADNGKIALDLFLSNEQNFDLIISDMKMPVMDGPTLLKGIRGRKNISQPKFIFCTGGTNINFEDPQDECNKLIDGYFFKPFNKENIQEVLHSVLTPFKTTL